MLILGVAGSVFSALVLYLSASGMLVAVKETVLLNAIPQKDHLSQAQSDLEFPVSVPGTTLLAQKISSYEGPFLEDGSDREVVNIAALQVYNAGDKDVLRAHIVLFCGDTSLSFYGEHIPAGVTVVLLERSAGTFRSDGFVGCSGWQEIDNSAQRIDGEISVSDIAMGTVVVTNLTDKTFQNVHIYYKSFLSPPGIYVGGITYTVEIPALLPGQTEHLYPYHYASGYSKVVTVTADTSKFGQKPCRDG